MHPQLDVVAWVYHVTCMWFVESKGRNETGITESPLLLLFTIIRWQWDSNLMRLVIQKQLVRVISSDMRIQLIDLTGFNSELLIHQLANVVMPSHGNSVPASSHLAKII